jgi:tRNA-splicing ligase RtcB
MEKITNKLFNWASILDEQTREQAIQTSGMPFVFPHLALMPDAHLGKGSTVGSVIPTEGAIMPAAIGVDIGCGMMAIKTDKTVADLATVDLKGLRESIESAIPLSAFKHNESVRRDAEVAAEELLDWAISDYGFNPSTYASNWKHQIGSLGSGNHFIEITKDEEGSVWLFLHSGSRGVGNKIATHHIAVAQDYAKRNFITLADPDLAYLVEGTAEFVRYIAEMTWAQKFAFKNREVMMGRVKRAFRHHVGDFEVLEEINCHHNFTQPEFHWGKNLWITRKGAISANEGQMGLIPGSMGTASYVVEGLGNPLSFCTAPHGAGREYSRNEARKTFTKESLDAMMEGIEWSHSDAFIDEHPNAYKDIDVVMEDAKDLVKIRHTLRQIINVKGD